MSGSASSRATTAGTARSRPAAAFALVRPLNLIIASCATLVGAWLQAARDVNLGPAFWSAAAVIAAVAGANAINDWVDRGGDAVNRPARPVPSGALPARAALVAALVSYGAAVFLATRVSVAAVGIVLLWVLVTVAYSLVLKSVPVVGNVVAAAVTASVLFFGSLSQGRPAPLAVLAAVALAFLFNLAREFAKDVQDVDGDRVQGVRTLATVSGSETALVAARVTIIVSMAAVAAPLALRIFGAWYGAVGVIVEALLVIALRSTARSGGAASPGRASALLKAAMVAGLAAVSLGIL